MFSKRSPPNELPLISPVMLAWAFVAGMLGALATAFFRLLIEWFEKFFSNSHGIVEMAHHLPWPVRLCLPILGGLLAGLCLNKAKTYIETSQHTDYMEAVTIGNGKIPLRVSIWRSLSSLATIVSGGAIGREGSMVQLSALSTSLFGRWIRLDVMQLRILVACGAAAGLAAAYNAPIAGSIFIVEIVLGAFSTETMVLILFSAMTSNLMMHYLSNDHPIYWVPTFPKIAITELPYFALLGVMCGGFASYYLYLRSQAKAYFQHLNLSLPLQLALGGLIVGILSTFVPEVWGNGCSVINLILHSTWTWQFLCLVLVFKFIAILITSGSGAVGGVFTPTIFIGCAFGALFGLSLHLLFPWLLAPAYAFAIVGMGAYLAAATQAPVMALFMILEMTTSYQILLPLTLACILAYVVAQALGRPAMYRIVSLHQAKKRAQMQIRQAHIDSFIESAQTVMSLNTPVSNLITVFSDYVVKYIYIVNEQQQYQGCVTLKDITHVLYLQQTVAEKTAQDFLVMHPALLTSEMLLEEAVQKVLGFPGERCPVIDSQQNRQFLGVVYKSSLLKMYHRLHES